MVGVPAVKERPRHITVLACLAENSNDGMIFAILSQRRPRIHKRKDPGQDPGQDKEEMTVYRASSAFVPYSSAK